MECREGQSDNDELVLRFEQFYGGPVIAFLTGCGGSPTATVKATVAQ
jgi:hypothetical protein